MKEVALVFLGLFSIWLLGYIMYLSVDVYKTKYCDVGRRASSHSCI